MTDKEMAEEYANKNVPVDTFGFRSLDDVRYDVQQAYLAGLKAGRPQWHKLDWEKDYPKVDRLVRVRTKFGQEYICNTYLYIPTEDEIGYGTSITQFEELNGDWVDDTEIEYWCYIEPFNFKE